MKRGFTLIELLVVMTIVALVVLLLISSISQFNGDYEKANYKIETKDDIHYVESYTKENGGECVYISQKELRVCGDYTIEKLNKNE